MKSLTVYKQAKAVCSQTWQAMSGSLRDFDQLAIQFSRYHQEPGNIAGVGRILG